MPVSFLPLIIPVILLGGTLLSLTWGRRAFLSTATAAGLVTLLFFASVYVPGWMLMWQASRGDAAATYELARWTENHNAHIGEFILWPFRSDVQRGYELLTQAADMNYPPAIYALGVRIKYGHHVPCPPDWKGPAGNCFPQPERGQALIDKALELGYQPSFHERSFYWYKFRK